MINRTPILIKPEVRLMVTTMNDYLKSKYLFIRIKKVNGQWKFVSAHMKKPHDKKGVVLLDRNRFIEKYYFADK